LALILGSGLVLIRVPSLYAAGPFLACWLFAPLVEIWLSLPATVPAEELKESDRRQLRRLACRTWSFFDTVVAEPDHWLPPDNWQENRAEPLAHRTSPTNIGFYLLATLAAHDFGYLNWLTLLARLENAFSSLGQLERSHGHFYNWYDTLTLQPLQPTYISSVDSGNLLACLMALKQGLHEGIRADQWAARAWHGFRDIHAEVEAELRALEAPQDADAAQPTQQLEVRLSAILRLLEAPPTQELEKLAELKQQADDLTQQVDALARAIGEPCEDLQAWAQRFAQLAQSRLEEAHSLGGDALTYRALRAFGSRHGL
jgi:cyclic beta-1,2-glucan synthetase